MYILYILKSVGKGSLGLLVRVSTTGYKDSCEKTHADASLSRYLVGGNVSCLPELSCRQFSSKNQQPEDAPGISPRR